MLTEGNDVQRDTVGANSYPQEPIAIVGIGCRYPGGIEDPSSYWEFLRRGRDGLVDIPAERWSARKFYDPDLGAGCSRVLRGGFLTHDVAGFDAQFFGISPREADFVDPQHRLLMEVAYEAIEDAGIPVSSLAGTPTGVFVGGFTLDYSQLQLSGSEQGRSLVRAHTATGVVMTMFSNRISHAFDLLGPSMSIDTACSSSLVATHLACQSLWSGESTAALAGGVNLMLAPNFTIAASQGGFLSPTSRSRPFQADADGYVRAEGCGIVILEKRSTAEAAGHKVYALIRGTAVNQDGHTNGITVPNGASQSKAMRRALELAGVDPGAVGYVEAHGTGTPVGDPIEVNAIGGVYGKERDPDERCLVGSVKSNFGHTEAAAGVAGLIKAALVLKHKSVPKHLHLTELNPKIDLEALGLDIPLQQRGFPTPGDRAYAAVNSFGFGGTNAHAVLEEASATTPAVAPMSEPGPAAQGIAPVVPVTARGSAALSAVAGQYAQLVVDGASPQGLSSAVVHRRALHAQNRAAALCTLSSDAVAALQALAAGTPHPDIITGSGAGAPTSLTWLFTGMGPQWWGMGRGLLQDNSVFAAEIKRVDAALTPLTGWSVLEELSQNETSSRMGETQVSQCANFAIQLALAAVWTGLGAPMDAIIGHSAGEVAAAYVAGALGFEDAVAVVFHRARLQQTTSGQGRLLAASITVEHALQLDLVRQERLHIAAVNAPESLALVGGVADLTKLLEELESKDVFARLVDGNVPFHGPKMDALEDEIRTVLAGIRPLTPRVRLYSTVTGELVTRPIHDADYWWRNVRQPVHFADAARAAILDGHRAFLELGPNPVLGHAAESCLAEAGQAGMTAFSLRKREPDSRAMATGLAKLFVHGFDLSWDTMYPTPSALHLPAYPWQREQYWMESEASRRDRTGAMAHPLLGAQRDTSEPIWVRQLDGSRPNYLADHRVHGANLFPGAGYIDMVLAAGREHAPNAHLSVRNVVFHNPVVMQGAVAGELETVLDHWTSEVQVNGRATGQRPWMRQMSAVLAPGRGFRAQHDIVTARERCQQAYTQDECYTMFRQGGFDYGPGFRIIESMWLGQAEAVARFDSQALGGDARAQRGEAIIDPLMLDGCFQLLLPLARALAFDLTQAVPVGVRRVELLPDLKARTDTDVVWAHARLTQLESDVVGGDIIATDDAGNVLLQVEGFQVRLVDADALTGRQGHHWLHQVDWEPLPLPGSENLSDALAATAPPPVQADGQPRPDSTQHQHGDEPNLEPHPWLILGADSPLGEHLASLLMACEDEVLLVTPSLRGRNPSPDIKVTKMASRNQLDEVLSWAQGRARGVGTQIIDLRATSDSTASLAASVSVACEATTGLLDLVQALDTANLPWPMTVVTIGAQPVTSPVSEGGVGQAAVWGMGRVLHQESTDLRPRLIDLDPDEPVECLTQLVDEVRLDADEDQVAVRAGTRFVARLQPSAEPATWLPVRLDPFGTYLITGGTGSLGLVCARWMARRGARRIVLTSRRGLPARESWERIQDEQQLKLIQQVLEVERLGATVEVVALDTTDTQELRQFVTDRRSAQLPGIRGVLHSAGVLHDTVMTRMSHGDLTEVLRPKVEGTLALHSSLSDEPLEFFALFSSVSSVVVTSGQANYAAANAYMDAFASYRIGIGQPAVAVNWGPWDVGMIAEANLEAFYSRRGIDLIPELVGVQLLSVILEKTDAQQVIVSADWPRLVASYPVVPKMIEHLAATAGGQDTDQGETVDWQAKIAAADPAEAQAIIEDGVADVIGAVLRIPPPELHRGLPLNQLGVDSMIAVELRIRIDRALGYSPKVVTLLQGVTVIDIAGLIAMELEPPEETPDDLADLADLFDSLEPEMVEALLAGVEAADQPRGRS